MKRESLAYAISCTLFGLILGWILGSQQAAPVPVAAPVASASAATAPAGATGGVPAPEAAPLDPQKVAQFQSIASQDPKNASVRTELGNMFFDAQKYDEAIPWYEGAYAISRKDPNVSTDLALAYFYTNQPDRALKQIDASLAIDPKHAKSLLNQGIIRWLGKNDLKGAAESWQKVVAVAPGSEEAKKAQQGLDGMSGKMAQGRGGRP